MARTVSERRYAQAVFQIALERGELDAWLEDLRLLAQARENEALFAILDAPHVSVSRKVGVANDAFGGSISPLALNLISLLASRNAAYLAADIAEHYQRLLDAHRGIERAEAVSAVPLSDEQRRKVEEVLRGIAGKEVRLTWRVDPHVLGGLVVRIGDRLLDGSTRARLQAMRRDVAERAAQRAIP